MSILSLLLISIGLAMDCFAVSIGIGTKSFSLKRTATRDRFELAFKSGLLFGAFQGGMAFIGWSLGSSFKRHLSDYDHWIAFFILFIIGAKMIYESIKEFRGACETSPKDKKIRKRFFIFLAFATSIDALAVGIGLGFLNVYIISAAFLIGVVSFILSFVGVELGHRLGCYMKSRAELLGGVILIVLGVKILIEHLYFQ